MDVLHDHKSLAAFSPYPFGVSTVPLDHEHCMIKTRSPRPYPVRLIGWVLRLAQPPRAICNNQRVLSCLCLLRIARTTIRLPSRSAWNTTKRWLRFRLSPLTPRQSRSTQHGG